MGDTETTLLDLERRMLRADAEFDSGFFEHYCASDFTVVSAYGVSGRDDVVAMYAQGTGDPSRRSVMADPRVLALDGAGGSALVTYRLTSTADGEPSTVYATSVYRRTPDGWRLVLLQQTPA
jgi:ketosteroid isomerase-like protein